MMAADKPTVLLVYGGRSTEHEVSRRSAAFIVRNLDYTKYSLEAIGISTEGFWFPQDLRLLQGTTGPSLPLAEDAKPFTPSMRLLTPCRSTAEWKELEAVRAKTIVFPMIHGAGGEDGILQGLCELNGVAYVGPDVMGSAVGMDKIISKRLVHEAGVPIVPYTTMRKETWTKLENRSLWCQETAAKLSYPMFVKPVTLGSSVGVTKVNNETELVAGINEACQYDDHVLIERGMDVREIEFGCLGGYDPRITSAGEIATKEGFYDYNAKYVSETAAEVRVPANLTQDQIATGQAMAKDAYKALQLYGLARVDLFLEKATQKFFFNEVNTIPGFTSISQYPMLWAHSGLAPMNLLEQLLLSAKNRFQERSQLRRKRSS